MSLINEALKRADKERHGSDGRAALNLWPASQEKPTQATPSRGKSVRGAIVLATCAIIAVAGVTYYSSPTDDDTPAEEGAKAPPIQPPPKVAQPVGKPAQGRIEPRKADSTAIAPAGPARPTDQRPRPTATPPTPPVKARPARPAPVSPAIVPVANLPPLSPENFKLGGIMQSDGSGHAIINNHLVTIGDEVGGARVAAIGKYHVVIERGGKQLTLRM